MPATFLSGIGRRRGLTRVFLIVFVGICSSGSFAQSASEINLLFFGDMMIGRRIEPMIHEEGIAAFFGGVRRLTDGRRLDDFDLVSANLEGAITAAGEKAPPVYPYDFAFPPERIAAVRDQGVSFLSIANNHLYDQGAEGVDSTRRYLSELGIAYSGDLDRVASVHSVVYLDIGGTPIAMIGLSEVYNPLNRDEVRRIVEVAEDQADVTIVNIHWGVEYEHHPRQHQRDMAQILAQSGADLIIGHHPHVVQGVEIVGAVPVFYSLGNFIFDQAFSDEVQQGCAVAVRLRRAHRDAVEFEALAQILPYRAERYVPRWIDGTDRAARLRQISQWSYGADVTLDAVADGAIPFTIDTTRR